MTADPTLTVEWSPTTTPFATPVWEDITDRAIQVSIRRGKARVLDAMQAGTATIVVDNSDGELDPNNTASAWYPNVKPRRRIRVRATYDAVTYGLFHGFIEAYPQPYGGRSVAVTPIRAVDGFKLLNLRKLTATYSQELSGARIANILDDTSWPAGDRNIDAGQTTVQARTHTDDNPLEQLFKVADSENGLLYINGDGQLRFIDRHSLMEAALDTATYTFGDGASDKPYEDIVVNYDDTDLWNIVNVSSQGVATQTASDAASIAAYEELELDRTGLLLISTDEQLAHATYLLTAYSEPATRVDKVTFGINDYWGALLGRDLGSKVLITRDPPGSGTALSQRSYVEGIDWDIQATPAGTAWRCAWNLVPTTRRADFWLVGDSVQSVLGSTTRLAY